MFPRPHYTIRAWPHLTAQHEPQWAVWYHDEDESRVCCVCRTQDEAEFSRQLREQIQARTGMSL